MSTCAVVLDALLGSCVAVCLFDPLLKYGGMNHILLPGAQVDRHSTRYGVHAMEILINELMRRGADRRRLVAKAFGGANVLPGLATSPVGTDNAVFAREFLVSEGIPLIAESLGGREPLHVRFASESGKAMVRGVGASVVSRIVRSERKYLSEGRHRQRFGETTLF